MDLRQQEPPPQTESACSATVRSRVPHKECIGEQSVHARADAGVMANGCPAIDAVQDGCCNPAVEFAEISSDRCCYWFCTGSCCGRPFVVDGRERVATTEERRDWQKGRAVRSVASTLDAATRGALADAWARDALMEHASIASFARFTLQLLAVGAPAPFLQAAQRSALDEVNHARACFALASRFAGRAIGPGPLPMNHAVDDITLERAAASAAVEGCIGETTAAIVAQARLREARDLEVRAVLETIVRDETAHALLAWRFVTWAISVGGESTRKAVAAAIQSALASHDACARPSSNDAAPLREYGHISASETGALAECARRDILAPAFAALLRRA
ncbi:ferritin-like domain-containing protein [Pendulispora rubella]|uniref:Ferritin-like domain-containing protein n=1 Tax=Pendulispora rubella TaxID=2741070 RepID=A0ABZ2L1I5_9BACT